MSTHLNTRPAPLDTDHLEPIGPIVRLQVQSASLKCGEKPHRWYDPAPIRSVPVLRLDSGGVTGVDDEGGDVADVHHRDYPQSKFRGENGVSVGFSGHYARMRDRFGDHLANGIAGENILIDTDARHEEAEFADGLVIAIASGLLMLGDVQVAAPCVEFSRYCAGYDRDQRSDQVITATLQFLHTGMRGLYATLENPQPGPVTIAVGDLVYRARRV